MRRFDLAGDVAGVIAVVALIAAAVFMVVGLIDAARSVNESDLVVIDGARHCTVGRATVRGFSGAVVFIDRRTQRRISASDATVIRNAKECEL